MKVPGGVTFDCDVVEPPAGLRGQEVRGRSVVKTPGTAQSLRGEIAGGAEGEIEWCDVRRHLARRGGGAGGSGGVEQLLPDSKEGEPTAMTRPPPRGERDDGNHCDQEPQDLQDLRGVRDFGDHRDGIREGHVREDTLRGHYPDTDYPDYGRYHTPSTSALANNPVSLPFTDRLITRMGKAGDSQKSF